MSQRHETQDVGAALGCGILVRTLIAAFIVAAFLGGLTQLCLYQFGVKVPFWGCVLAWVLIRALFNIAKGIRS